MINSGFLKCFLALVIFLFHCAPSWASDIYSKESILQIMDRVFNWQVSHPEPLSNDWQQSVLQTGIMAAYQQTKNKKYLSESRSWADKNGWKIRNSLRKKNGDGQCCAQTYLDIYLIKKNPRMLRSTQDVFNKLLENPSDLKYEWWWADALFMVPPVMTRLGRITNDPKYVQAMEEMWWGTARKLLDKDKFLFYRDQKAKKEKTKSGMKVFWARGNGWVMAGTARILDYLPPDSASRKEHIKLFQEMAHVIIQKQGEDGLWRPSLLDAKEYPQPETSSSALFCFALAWGINHGILDRDIYLPVVQKAWKGLYNSVDGQGKLGWVQEVGRAPAVVYQDHTAEYGVGAFLLAASEMLCLK